VALSANAEALLGTLLVEHGVVSEAEVERALIEQAEIGGRLGELLVARGALSRPSLARAVAAQSGVLLETEAGFGTGLRGLIEHRHLQRSGLSPRTFETEPDYAVPTRRERRLGFERRSGSERRSESRPSSPDEVMDR